MSRSKNKQTNKQTNEGFRGERSRRAQQMPGGKLQLQV